MKVILDFIIEMCNIVMDINKVQNFNVFYMN